MKKRFFGFFLAMLFMFGSVDSYDLFASTSSQSQKTEVKTSFVAGPLTLKSVPVSFDFGANAISPVVMTKSLTAGTMYTVSISDLRSMGRGYRVAVSAPVLESDDGTKLYGNNIQMQNGAAYLIGTPNSNILPPTVNKSFYVDQVDSSGSTIPTTIIEAKGSKTGLLQWDTRWTGNNITLIVQPGEATAEKYKTTITWTLYDAP